MVYNDDGAELMLPPPTTQFRTSPEVSSVGALLVDGAMD